MPCQDIVYLRDTKNKGKEAKQSGMKEGSLVIWPHVESQVVGFQRLSGILH